MKFPTDIIDIAVNFQNQYLTGPEVITPLCKNILGLQIHSNLNLIPGTPETSIFIKSMTAVLDSYGLLPIYQYGDWPFGDQLSAFTCFTRQLSTLLVQSFAPAYRFVASAFVTVPAYNLRTILTKLLEVPYSGTNWHTARTAEFRATSKLTAQQSLENYFKTVCSAFPSIPTFTFVFLLTDALYHYSPSFIEFNTKVLVPLATNPDWFHSSPYDVYLLICQEHFSEFSNSYLIASRMRSSNSKQSNFQSHTTSSPRVTDTDKPTEAK